MSGERNGIEREDILNDILEERREFEGRLEHQLNRLEQLIGALVNISRMETGMIRLQPETGRIFDTILEAVNGIWVKAQKKNIEIQMDAGDDIEDLMISHDRKWLCEALLNLLEFIISGIVEQSLEELENQSYTAYVSQACYESLYRPAGSWSSPWKNWKISLIPPMFPRHVMSHSTGRKSGRTAFTLHCRMLCL